MAATKRGINPVWAAEIEPFPIEVTKKHFPTMKHLGDITGINGAEIEPVDIICMGSPCQDLSIAGKREGLAGARSGLFMDAVRIIREMREATNGKYPKFVVWENVPGAFSSNKGNDFRAVLEEITESSIPMPKSGRWAHAGMVRSNECDVAWRTLDAQYWGVPQRRKRIFLVAGFGGQCAEEILFKPESVCRNTAEGSGEREGITGSVTNGTRAAGNTSGVYCVGNGQLDQAKLSEKVGALNCMHDQQAVIIPYQTKIGCLNARDYKGIGSQYVSEDKCIVEAYGIGYVKEQAPTLSTAQNEAVMVWDMTHATVQRFAGDTKDSPGAAVGGVDMYNQAFLPKLAQTLRAAEGGDSTPTVLAPVTKEPVTFSVGNPVRVAYVVRRLTPTECERLQGLPDGYTAGGSDSARYKAIGNGMAQPCADFVIRKISRVLGR